MILIGICDDEARMRKSLRIPLERTLELLGYDYHIEEYDSGEALLMRPPAASFDILFLDIEMKTLSGMETAKALRRQGISSILIFVTAYPDYVFQGYEVHAFHYILKPYQEQKIVDVLKQAVAELDCGEERFFSIEQKSGIQKIPLKDIIFFQSDRRKVLVKTKDREFSFYGKLNEIEETLPDFFIRIHNRYLINLNYVTALGKDNCVFGKDELPVSRTYRQKLEIAFAKTLLH